MTTSNLKVAVVAANGRTGQLIVSEALGRGLDVTAVVRGENRSAARKCLSSDALELTAEDLAGFDVVVEGPDFPEDWKPLSAAHGAALADLRSRSDVRWTYVSPAADFVADGERTGAYTLAGEELTLNAAGASTVSYADYAIAIVDLAESGEHVCERVSVVSK